jgi:hypothetical protein
VAAIATHKKIAVGKMSTSEQRENARLVAAELANVELLMETTRPVTLVVPQTEDEKIEEDDNP